MPWTPSILTPATSTHGLYLPPYENQIVLPWNVSPSIRAPATCTHGLYLPPYENQIRAPMDCISLHMGTRYVLPWTVYLSI